VPPGGWTVQRSSDVVDIIPAMLTELLKKKIEGEYPEQVDVYSFTSGELSN